ncbi:hypothetical protein PSC71_18140 [Devosia sp. J2-20]|uniref:hypothetical protein n=1 Tax=Devosia sp. J2-20 TaxID=3026161 RepID=UPI00249C7D75|nr:hypothetical protein [Devosia sp. J2-20]WDQ99074.1 hypothetical protein PSC71_18140 [Devosia sp. J2-20]|tara:strand:- start:8847 stop:9344 length:498 start_codon:yes stop_codon:yes gene_type:complete
MRTGLLVMIAAGLAMVLPATAADRFDDPKALVAAIYAEYQPGTLASEPTAYYSRRLQSVFDQALENRMFANDAAISGAEFKPAEMFNPFLPDVSALLFDLTIGEPLMIGDRAVVSVSYHNFDHPRLLSIATVREDGGWKVDDVAALGSDENWLLSWALTYDPLGF